MKEGERCREERKRGRGKKEGKREKQKYLLLETREKTSGIEPPVVAVVP